MSDLELKYSIRQSGFLLEKYLKNRTETTLQHTIDSIKKMDDTRFINCQPCFCLVQ